MIRALPLSLVSLFACAEPGGGSGGILPGDATGSETGKTDDPSADATGDAALDGSDGADADACVPSQRRCTAAGVVETCNTQSVWEPTRDCASDGLTCLAGSCQSPCQRDPKAHDNTGCDYWAVDMDNHALAQDGPFAVIVSNLSSHASHVRVTRKDGAAAAPTVVLERDLAAGALAILDLPNRHAAAPGISWTGYRVESTVPIIAYQFNPLSNVDVFSNDATILIPSNTFGREYYVVSRFELLGQGVAPGTTMPYRGTFSVVASEPGTTVTFTPTCATQAGPGFPALTAGRTHSVTLGPYQVLNVKSDENGGDLTGTRVVADKPIAVFGGHEAALSSTTCCADHLEHQLYPVATWGTTYVATKSRARQAEADYWRVIAAQDRTTVTFSPAIAPPRTLDAGQWFELKTHRDFVVSADRPISVAQTFASSGEVVIPSPFASCTADGRCATGYTCDVFDPDTGQTACFPPVCRLGAFDCPVGHICTDYGGGQTLCAAVGDPTLIVLPPEKQFRTDYVFLTPDKYRDDWINIVAPADATVMLDDAPVPAQDFTAIADSPWKVARIPVRDGVHRVYADQPISVIAYGYDRDVSYGYAAGLNLVPD